MDFANETEADLAADACDVSDKPVRSPVHLPKAVHKKWICEVFDIDPDAVTARHVLDEKRAFARFINGFLLNDKTPLGLCTHGRLGAMGRVWWSGLFPKSNPCWPIASIAALQQRTDSPSLCRRSTHPHHRVWCQWQPAGVVSALRELGALCPALLRHPIRPHPLSQQWCASKPVHWGLNAATGSDWTCFCRIDDCW